MTTLGTALCYIRSIADLGVLSLGWSPVWECSWVWNVQVCYSWRKSCWLFPLVVLCLTGRCLCLVDRWRSNLHSGVFVFPQQWFGELNEETFSQGTVVIFCFDKGCQVQHWSRWKPEELLVAHRRHYWPGQTLVEGCSQRGLEGQDLLPLVPPTQTCWWLHQVPTNSQESKPLAVFRGGVRCLILLSPEVPGGPRGYSC